MDSPAKNWKDACVNMALWEKMKKYLIVFCGLIAAYILLMILCFLIPNSWVSEHYEASTAEFYGRAYWSLDSSLEGTTMDGQTDQRILYNCMKEEGHSVIYDAMDVHDYARYWHGYLIIVRPLLCVMRYAHIKYISMILCFALLCAVYGKVSALLDKKVAMAMVIAFSMGNIVAIPLLLQYMSMYYVTVIGILLYCVLYQRNKINMPGLFFLILGSVTNFFDFLTTPLMSLGMVLVVAFALYALEAGYTLGKGIGFIIGNSVTWVMGYGLTWFAKWCISSVILRRNVIADGFEQVLFRTEGSDELPVDRIGAVILNLKRMFPKGALLLMGTLGVIWLICFFRRHEKGKRIIEISPVLLLAVYPVIWYFVLANHSEIHDFFTYRSLVVSVFAVLAFGAMCIKTKAEEKERNA
jgi:hypothetical protein